MRACNSMHEFEMAQAPDQRHGPHRPIDVNGDAAGTLVIERELPHPPEKVWRALASASLLGEWLMPTDFRPVPGKQVQVLVAARRSPEQNRGRRSPCSGAPCPARIHLAD